MHPYQSLESAMLFLRCSHIYENHSFRQLGVTEGTSSEVRQHKYRSLLCCLPAVRPDLSLFLKG